MHERSLVWLSVASVVCAAAHNKTLWGAGRCREAQTVRLIAASTVLLLVGCAAMSQCRVTDTGTAGPWQSPRVPGACSQAGVQPERGCPRSSIYCWSSSSVCVCSLTKQTLRLSCALISAISKKKQMKIINSVFSEAKFECSALVGTCCMSPLIPLLARWDLAPFICRIFNERVPH